MKSKHRRCRLSLRTNIESRLKYTPVRGPNRVAEVAEDGEIVEPGPKREEGRDTRTQWCWSSAANWCGYA